MPSEKHRNSTIRIVGKTDFHIDRLTIEGINPDRVEFVVREYWDPEGAIFEVEHIPTKTRTRGWVSNGLGVLMDRCRDEILVTGELDG